MILSVRQPDGTCLPEEVKLITLTPGGGRGMFLDQVAARAPSQASDLRAEIRALRDYLGQWSSAVDDGRQRRQISEQDARVNRLAIATLSARIDAAELSFCRSLGHPR